MAEEKYAAGTSCTGAGDPKPESAYARLIRDMGRAGVVNRAAVFGAAYRQKFRLNSYDRQWYPAEPEYDAMNEPEAYWTRLLGELAVSVARNHIRPYEIKVEGARGGRCGMLDTLNKVWVTSESDDARNDDKPTTNCANYVPSETKCRTSAGPGSGAENWEANKEGLERDTPVTTADYFATRSRTGERTTRQLFDELNERLEKHMRGLRALLFDIDKELNDDRREAMEVVVREAVRAMRRRLPI